MTCESFALVWGGGWAAHEVSENDGLSFPGSAPAGERQAFLYCIETVQLPPMHHRLRQADELPRYLQRHCRRDVQEAEAQEEVQGSLHEFGTAVRPCWTSWS